MAYTRTIIRNYININLLAQETLLGSRASTIYNPTNHRIISSTKHHSLPFFFSTQGVRSLSTSTIPSKIRTPSTPSKIKRSFHPLTPELAKAATQCVAETFATQEDPFTW